MENDYRVAAAVVCFPAHWCLREKFSKGLLGEPPMGDRHDPHPGLSCICIIGFICPVITHACVHTLAERSRSCCDRLKFGTPAPRAPLIHVKPHQQPTCWSPLLPHAGVHKFVPWFETLLPRVQHLFNSVVAGLPDAPAFVVRKNWFLFDSPQHAHDMFQPMDEEEKNG